MAARKPSHVRKHDRLIREQAELLRSVFSEVSKERRVASELEGTVMPMTSRGFGEGGRQFREASGKLQRVNAPPQDPKAAIERRQGLRPLQGYVTYVHVTKLGKRKLRRRLEDETQLRALGTKPVEHGCNPATLTHSQRRLLKQVERFDGTVWNDGVLFEKDKFPEDM